MVFDRIFRRLGLISSKRQHHSGIIISPDAVVGKNVLIKAHTIIGSGVVLAQDVTVGSRAVLERITVGSESEVASRVVCTGSHTGRITVGSNSYIGISNILDHSADISIGSYVHIAGPSTALWTHSSHLMCLNSIALKNKSPENVLTKPIKIEDNVFIGGNCTINPGVTIGHHSIVAPNSAVTEDVEPYSMVGGVPAKFIKQTHDIITEQPGK
jgi:acetyltransferase-like isoleucine patch superfamily enzyme